MSRKAEAPRRVTDEATSIMEMREQRSTDPIRLFGDLTRLVIRVVFIGEGVGTMLTALLMVGIGGGSS